MIERFKITIPQLTEDEERMAYVYLPTSYFDDEDRAYPVLYMFDGQNLFDDEEASYGESWHMEDYLDFSNAPLIVAAVECNHHPLSGRMEEYSPFTDDDPEFGHIEGKGDIYFDWLINEFKAYIDDNYRTLPEREFTYIGGSSMGGHMSLYGLMIHNDIFSKAAILSPTLWFGIDEFIPMIKEAEIDPYTIAYMDYGTLEFEEYEEAYDQYKDMVALLMDKDVILTSRLVPYGDHSEHSWSKQLEFFIDVLLYDVED